MLNQIKKNDELKPGSYYRRRPSPRPNKKDRIQANDLVLVLDVDDTEVNYTAYADNEWYHVDLADFLKRFEFEPNGRAIRDKEFQTLLNQASGLADDITNDAEQLQGIEMAFRPNALPGIDDSIRNTPMAIPDHPEPGNEAESVSLARINPASSTLETANKWIGDIAARRDLVNEKKDKLAVVQKRIEGLQKEMKAWMEALTSFKDITKRLNEVISTLNLYLGSGEEIIQLANGAPASSSIPLSIRQLVLYMDEECAINAERGGIDARSIPEFDKWLLNDPRNLDQVLPEAKGIVCIKPRRSKVEYSKDAYVNAALNEANHETYILIRNGENLFRLTTAWQTGDYFFPVKNEFEQYEYKSDYDWDTRQTLRKKITPKDGRDYEKMLETIDRLETHYSRALILLQGIVDRTGIFPELQTLGLNLMDITSHNQYLRFIHDADPSKLLVTGRETFGEWQARTNRQLLPGDRIMGIFNRFYGANLDERTRSQWAGKPNSMELYTLEKSASRQWDFKIMFEGANSYSYGERQYRISFNLSGRDTEIIAYDRITLEDADYFLNDRLSRESYMDMFPLLRLIRDMKCRERMEEKPFIDLLIDRAGQHLDLSPDILESQIREVVGWYKFKNKQHRSLKEDDSKAFRMIMAEWMKRRRSEIGIDSMDSIIDQIKTDQTLLIARRDAKYIHIERADQNHIFIHRTDFNIRNNRVNEIERREWKMVNKEYLTWLPIFEHPDWAEWPKGARINDFLNPMEFASIRPELERLAAERLMNSCSYFMGLRNRNEKDIRNLIAVPFRIDLSLPNKIQLTYYLEGYARGSNEYLYTEMSADVEWYREDDQIKFAVRDYHGWSEGHMAPDGLRAETSWHPGKSDSFIYWVDQDAIKMMDEKRNVKKDKSKARNKQQYIVSDILRPMRDEINRLREQRAKDKYIADHGDPRNWESYKKRADINYLEHDAFSYIHDPMLKAIRKMKIVDRAIFEGKTFIEILDLLKMDSSFIPAYSDIDMTVFIPISIPEVDDESEDEAMDDDELDEQPGDITWR